MNQEKDTYPILVVINLALGLVPELTIIMILGTREKMVVSKWNHVQS